MHVIQARNVNYALPAAITDLHIMGVREPSRNGDVLKMPMPVTTVYERPMERVMFHPWRDANPFFHLVEAMWMLAGRDTLKDLTPYVKRMAEYSDDGGVTQPAAYGKRWRSHNAGDFECAWIDQLNWAVKRLRENPADRRVVIQMWDVQEDPLAADRGSKDVPCNLTALPWVGGGALHLTVFCRSNDMVWGAYGANAVHFSVMLEYLAGRICLPVGTYTQISNNFHAYVEGGGGGAGDPDACWPVGWTACPYASGIAKPFGLFDNFNNEFLSSDKLDMDRELIIQQDLKVFFEHGWFESSSKARWPFLGRIVVPMAAAHAHYKKLKTEDRFTGALDILKQMPVGNDWRLAAEDWLIRRHQAWSTSR